MRKSKWLALGLGLFSVLPAMAAEETAARPADPLAPFTMLAGHCWVAPFPDGKTTDTHCFEWLYGRHQLIDRHVVRGSGQPEYRGETLYLWDAATARIIYRYVDSAGGHSDGHVEPQESRLHFPADEYVGADGKATTFVTEWHQADDRHYEARVRQRTAESLRDVMQFQYERVDPATESTTPRP